jgi:hypothetical protein
VAVGGIYQRTHPKAFAKRIVVKSKNPQALAHGLSLIPNLIIMSFQ